MQNEYLKKEMFKKNKVKMSSDIKYALFEMVQNEKKMDDKTMSIKIESLVELKKIEFKQ